MTSRLPTLTMNPRLEPLILAAHHILILTHIGPDGDAVGSLLGLGKGLQALGKTVLMACSDPVPERYAMLPGYAGVVTQVSGTFDLVIGVDCGDRERMGHLYQADRWRHIPLINIDHHASNTHFGSANWVEPSAVATTEMVLDLLDRLGAPVDMDTATCLLYGIVADTLALRTSNVTPQVLAKVIRLMQLGAPLHQAVTDLFQRKPLGLLAVWGHALNTMHVEGRMAWTVLSAQERHACGYPSTDGTQLPSLLLEADGIDVSAVFLEDDQGIVEISLRARNGMDVSGLAVELGGGGHRNAAGVRLPGPLDDVVERVVARLRQSLISNP
jgi:bifunctional oligoribonuclease and PAP phosphatase NrnA